MRKCEYNKSMEEIELKLMLEGDYSQAFNYQERRHKEWLENYTLSRGKTTYNRLTQRQTVTIPLMKETIRTWLANVDDAPGIEFNAKGQVLTDEEVGGKEEREMVLNEYWADFFLRQKVALKDIVDKRQVGLYGRSFKKLNVIDGHPTLEINDPKDILIDRYADPTDIDTGRFVIHTHIYRTLTELEASDKYDQKVVAEMKEYYATEQGLVKSADNYKAKSAQTDKMQEMGVPDVDSPRLGETYIELNEHYRKIDDEIYLIVKSSEYILMNKPLEEVIGKTSDHFWKDHYPFSTWADDLELDVWSDGLADIVRPINKVLNSWFAQLIENRTLRNFGMNYYDATNQSFVPQTFEPLPWGWYPVPGDPNKIVKKIDIPDLSESLDEMDYLTKMAEKASSVTSIEKGVAEKKQITLGEVEILAGKTRERTIATAKFYVPSWKDFAYRWCKFIEAQKGNLASVKLSKKSWNGNKVYTKVIGPNDWLSKDGYDVEAVSSSEQEAQTINTVRKFMSVLGQMPDNVPLRKIYLQKLLEMINLSPEEKRTVMDFEKQKGVVTQMPQTNQPMVESVNNTQNAVR